MTTRLSRPESDSMTTDTRQLLELTERDGHAPATIEVLAHSPALVGPFLGWAAALALEGTLTRRDHEILALRISHLCESPFEIDEHNGFALDAGMTPTEIDALGGDIDDGPWSESERALLTATDELHRDSRVGTNTYTSLEAHFTPAQLAEIPMVVGQYAMLSMVTGFFAIDARSAISGAPNPRSTP